MKGFLGLIACGIIFLIPSVTDGRIREQCLLKNLREIGHEDLRQRGAITQIDHTTVRSSRALHGNHGGILYVIHRKKGKIFKKRWHYYDKSPNPQGHPHFFRIWFGPEIADFFGFRKLSRDEITVPDADELNGAIEAMNQRLPETSPYRIKVSFYSDPHDQLEDVEYLERTLRYEHPIQANIVHDVAYHIPYMFTPEPLQERANLMTQGLLDFKAFAEEKGLDPDEVYVLKRMIQERALSFDLATARLGQAQKDPKMFKDAINFFTEKRRTPKDYLKKTALESIKKRVKKGKRKGAQKRFLSLIDEFMAQEASKKYQNAGRMKASKRSLYKEFKERVQVAREAAKDFNQESSQPLSQLSSAHHPR